MKITALCKTWKGSEWIKPMALSIYPFVDKIVFVNSDVSWTGQVGNSCRMEINQLWRETGKVKSKIVSLDYNTTDQNKQVMFGYEYIQKNLKPDFVMLIDTDEVWDNYNLSKAIQFLERKPNYPAYRCSMYTYIKSPFWRVTPVEPLAPVCFISSKLDDLGRAARACGLHCAMMNDGTEQKIFLHHYVYVRDHFNTVLEKIITSHSSENALYSDMSVWIPEVWNKLPHIADKNGFHPAIGYQRNWMNLEVIDKSQLPDILKERSFPIVEKFRKE